MVVRKNKKIAVWGLGNHALNNIIPAIHIIKNLDLYGVYSRNRDIVKDCCNNWDCKSWNSVEDMLIDSNLDIIYLATPPGLHFEHGMKVLKSDKHLWCEKPLTTDLKSSKILIDISVEKKLSIFEGFMYLYHPQFIKLKKYIDSKVFGEPKVMYCRFGLPKMDSPGFRFNKQLGGSCLFDVGCYPFSAMLALFPDKEIEIIDSYMEKSDSESIDYNGRAHIKIDSKINFILEWAYNIAYRNEIDIWAEKGNIYTDKIFSKRSNYIPNFKLRDLYGNSSHFDIEPKNHFELMFRYFSNSITSQKKINQEKERILKLASLLEKIIKNSSPNSER